MEKNENKKKRILVFVTEFPVLTETFIERDLSKLVELGNLDISVVTIKKGNGELSENLKDKTYFRRISFIDIFYSLPLFFSKKLEIRNSYNLLKRDITRSNLSKLYLLFKSVVYSYIFSKFTPDEIHVHFLSEPSTIALIASVILHVPFSINAHARDILEYPNLPKTKAEIAKFITVCNTNAYKRCQEISDGDISKIYLIHHGIDAEKIFNYPQTVKKPNRPLIFMGGSRLTEKKGIENMIEASRLLLDRGADHEVHLIGPGDLYKNLQKKILDLKLANNFFIHGEGNGAPFSEISQYYKIADIFVLPIIETKSGDADGIPNAIIEAALARLPIITTSAGSVSELIIDNETGVIIPSKNSEVLATEIEKILFDNERKHRLGNAVYFKAKEMFDQSINVKKLETLLLS